jgi:hypothetical protein
MNGHANRRHEKKSLRKRKTSEDNGCPARLPITIEAAYGLNRCELLSNARGNDRFAVAFWRIGRTGAMRADILMPRRTSAFFPAVVTWKSGGVMANARFMQFNANQVRAFSKCSEMSTLGALQKTENKAR